MGSLNILVVENESLVALEIMQSIQEFGYIQVEYATTIDMAKDILTQNSINLILMDINLGKEIDGIDFYKSLNIDTPIIYLTAYKDEATISKAIATNPLGYLIKPVNSDELNVLLKLAQYKLSTQNQKIELGDGYYFDKKEDRLFYNDKFIHLGAKELKLLKLLISARGNFVSYYTIEDEVWGSESISSSSLRTLIYRLRGKLNYKLIEVENSYGVKIP